MFQTCGLLLLLALPTAAPIAKAPKPAPEGKAGQKAPDVKTAQPAPATAAAGATAPAGGADPGVPEAALDAALVALDPAPREADTDLDLTQAPVKADAPAAAGTGAPAKAAKVRLFSLDVKDKPVDAVLTQFAKSAGVPLDLVSPNNDEITLRFSRLPFQKALERILLVAALDYRLQEGVYLVGLPLDLKLKIPEPDEKTLDATYRCKHLDPDSMAQAIARALPQELKVTQGPRFLTPTLDGSNDTSGNSDQGARPLAGADPLFKVHDIVLSGPAALVRRGLMLARKFDRPRQQVRINIRIAEISDAGDSNLGMTWMSNGGLPLMATEQANAAGTVDGIRLGRFSHSPMAVNATLNALEHQNKARTLANPSLLLLDGERSFILSGEKYQLPKIVGKDLNNQAVYDTTEIRVGIYLQVAVQVGMNRDVVMNLIPQVTNLIDIKNYNQAEYPIISTREAQTTVRAKSGEMIVLGGLKIDNTTEGREGIPLLGRIPFLGRLFSALTKRHTKSELMIFLTPEVLVYEELNEPVTIDVTETPDSTGH
jgi:type II secretory pathway component GspD/PulD (secretin)